MGSTPRRDRSHRRGWVRWRLAPPRRSHRCCFRLQRHFARSSAISGSRWFGLCVGRRAARLRREYIEEAYRTLHLWRGISSPLSTCSTSIILATTAMAVGFSPIIASAPRILSGSLLRYRACHAEGRKLLTDGAEALVFVARPPRNAFAMKSLTSEDRLIRPSPRCRPLVLSCLLAGATARGVRSRGIIWIAGLIIGLLGLFGCRLLG